jgi:hypothetical protein
LQEFAGFEIIKRGITSLTNFLIAKILKEKIIEHRKIEDKVRKDFIKKSDQTVIIMAIKEVALKFYKHRLITKENFDILNFL